MIAKVKNLKPGMIFGDMGSVIETIEKTDERPDKWWGDVYKIKVDHATFETYGEMEFECYWP